MTKAFRFVYGGIRVRDLRKSLDFYRNIMGMRVTRRRTMPHDGKFVGLRIPGSDQELELNWSLGEASSTKYKRGDEVDHIAFGVGDVKAAFEKLVSRGVEAAVSPSNAKGITEVYVKDLDDIWIELLNW